MLERLYNLKFIHEDILRIRWFLGINRNILGYSEPDGASIVRSNLHKINKLYISLWTGSKFFPSMTDGDYICAGGALFYF